MIKEVKNTVPRTYVINYLNGEEIIGKRFMKKNYTKQTNKKGDKLYVKWKGYDNSFNSWINKKN